MEIRCIVDVFDFCGFHVVFQSTEVILVEFILVLGCEALILWWIRSSIVFLIDCAARCFSEVLSEQVFRLNLGDETGVTWDVLSFDVSMGTTEPVISVLGVVCVLHSLVHTVLRGLL